VNGTVLGWGSLELSDEALKKVLEHPNIDRTYEDKPVRRARAIDISSDSTYTRRASGVLPALTKRSKKFKRLVDWYKQEYASWNLRAVSQPPYVSLTLPNFHLLIYRGTEIRIGTQYSTMCTKATQAKMYTSTS
jgi:hypothetical protein